jgi:hypothetical protein
MAVQAVHLVSAIAGAAKVAREQNAPIVVKATNLRFKVILPKSAFYAPTAEHKLSPNK